MIALLLSFAAPVRCAPAAEDPEEPLPGLFASFSPRDSSAPRTVRLVDDLGGDWGSGAPDPRIPADAFEARWTGSLLVQSPGSHRFHARTDGTVVLRIGGKVALAGSGSDCQGGPLELAAGLVPLTLEYRHASGQARVAIDWEGPGFSREPLPSRLLFHEPDAAQPIDRFEQGRRLADRFGCANCHEMLDLPTHRFLGPPLRHAGHAIDPRWLAGWLQDPLKTRPSSRMPALGPGLSAQEAADLGSFLRRAGGTIPAPSNEAKMALNVASPSRGRLLFRSLGCLGCHRRGEPGVETPSAPDLADLGRKRDASGLALFLEHPKQGKTPSRHRPDLRLTADEAADLAVYLVTDPPPPVEQDQLLPEGDPMRGRALAERARCASCHEIPGLAPASKRIPVTQSTRAHSGCLADVPVKDVPRFGLTGDQRRDLRAFIAGLPAHPSPLAPSTRAEDVIRRLNCLGCHARDGRGGTELGQRVAHDLSEDQALGALKGTLTPPNLTAAGDKLRPDYLALAVRGQAPTARPWLAVRMPAFPFDAGEAEAITEFFQNHDRMRAPDEPATASPAPVPDHAATERGAILIGQRGFGCISCHVLAGRIPPGGEPETLGPDLALAHRRTTKRYFERWLANPQRIIPGTPMPQFVQAVPNAAGTLRSQLDAIWTLLASPRLAEVAASGTREILKRQGDRAMVVRDMVLLPGAPGTRYVPRGLAIGLKNEHSLLFDTDRLTWLGWWRHGFLYRTKSGRLWEWHPEGERIWTAPDRLSPVVFVDPQGKIVPPRAERERFGSFLELEFQGDSVMLSYRLNGPDDSPVEVTERVRPVDGGWERDVTVSALPRDYQAALVVPASSREEGNGTRFRVEVEDQAGEVDTAEKSRRLVRMRSIGSEGQRLRCRYRIDGG